jgi:hypothetical protein
MSMARAPLAAGQPAWPPKSGMRTPYASEAYCAQWQHEASVHAARGSAIRAVLPGSCSGHCVVSHGWGDGRSGAAHVAALHSRIAQGRRPRRSACSLQTVWTSSGALHQAVDTLCHQALHQVLLTVETSNHALTAHCNECSGWCRLSGVSSSCCGTHAQC